VKPSVIPLTEFTDQTDSPSSHRSAPSIAPSQKQAPLHRPPFLAAQPQSGPLGLHAGVTSRLRGMSDERGFLTPQAVTARISSSKRRRTNLLMQKIRIPVLTSLGLRLTIWSLHRFGRESCLGRSLADRARSCVGRGWQAGKMGILQHAPGRKL
jgi:hypothetical protein